MRAKTPRERAFDSDVTREPAAPVARQAWKRSRVAVPLAVSVALLAGTAAQPRSAELDGSVALSAVIGARATPAEVDNRSAPLTGASSSGLSLLAQVDSGGTGGDLAFWGDLAVMGLGDGVADSDLKDDGFLLVNISDPRAPRTIVHFPCNGAGTDVAIWRDLVFLSGEHLMAGPGCDERAAEVGAEEAFAGLRIVSIKNRHRPELIASIPTNLGGAYPGAHTFTLLPDPGHRSKGQPVPRLLLYTNNAAPADIVEVPLRDPAGAKVIGAVDPRPGSLGCHDLSFFVPRNLALCAGINESQLWDVSDPLAPRVLSHIVNPAIHHHHSAAFSWDGKTLILSEENIENISLERCAGGSASVQGALWFYDITTPTSPRLLSHFQLPQTSDRYCTAHQMNVVPLSDGRDVLVAGWYSGGTTVVDFTDRDDPHQLGFFQGDGSDEKKRSNAWSSYWYDGHVYSSNFAFEIGGLHSVRGLDVLGVTEGLEFLRHAVPLGRYNFGLQEAIDSVTPS